MSKWKRVTPALCGIADEIPVPTIKQKWNEWIAPVMQEESKICYCAFLVCKFVFSYPTGNRKTAHKLFVPFLEDTEGFRFEHEDIAKGVFYRYWDFARATNYWQAEYNQLPPFDVIVTKWLEISKAEIDVCQAKLCAGWPDACQE